MTKLDISFNYKNENSGGNGYYHLSEDFIRPIAGMLKTNASITDLNISNNWLNAEAARILSQDIRDNRALAKLNLSGNRICPNLLNGTGEHDQAGIRALAGALKTNTSLTDLNIAGNDLDVEAARIFSQGIPDMGALAKLDLSNNNTYGSPNFIRPIATMLKQNTSLKELNLTGIAPGSHDDVTALCDAIKT